MKKLLLIILIFSFITTGCKDDLVLEEKNNYLTYKEKLLKQEEFSNKEDINFDLNIYVDRVNDEEISYRAIIDNPKENMHNIKAIVVQDYFTDEIFPSIGIFDDSTNLIVGDENVKGITLVGYIKTTKDIEELNLEVRVYIEYQKDDGTYQKIYYKS